MQTQERGQGLLLDASDLAATAKLYGEDYGVMLSHFSDSFMRTIPELKDVPLANMLLDGFAREQTARILPCVSCHTSSLSLGKTVNPLAT